MSFTVSQLAGSLESGVVTVRGKARDARPVFAREALRMEECLPRPQAPFRLDPDKGVKAPMVRDYDDAGFQAKSAARSTAMACGWIAVALSLTDEAGVPWSVDMEPAASRAWLEANAVRMTSAFTAGEITAMLGEVERLGAPSGKESERIGTDQTAGN